MGLLSRERRWSSWLAVGGMLGAAATTIALVIVTYEAANPSNPDVNVRALQSVEPELIVSTGFAAITVFALITFQKWIGSLVAWTAIFASGMFLFWAIIGLYNLAPVPDGTNLALFLGAATWLAVGVLFVTDVLDSLRGFQPLS